MFFVQIYTDSTTRHCWLISWCWLSCVSIRGCCVWLKVWESPLLVSRCIQWACTAVLSSLMNTAHLCCQLTRPDLHVRPQVCMLSCRNTLVFLLSISLQVAQTTNPHSQKTSLPSWAVTSKLAVHFWDAYSFDILTTCFRTSSLQKRSKVKHSVVSFLTISGIVSFHPTLVVFTLFLVHFLGMPCFLLNVFTLDVQCVSPVPDWWEFTVISADKVFLAVVLSDLFVRFGGIFSCLVSCCLYDSSLCNGSSTLVPPDCSEWLPSANGNKSDPGCLQNTCSLNESYFFHVPPHRRRRRRIYLSNNNNINNNKKIHWEVAREGYNPSMLATYDKS